VLYARRRTILRNSFRQVCRIIVGVCGCLSFACSIDTEPRWSLGGDQLFPEFRSEFSEYVNPNAQPAPLFNCNGVLATSLADVQPLVFVIDGTFDQPTMQRLSDYVESCVRLLGATVPIALIVFSNVVSIYDLSISEMAASYTLPAGEAPLVVEHLDSPTVSRCMMPFGTCATSLQHALHSLVDAALPTDVAHKVYAIRQRALGSALDVALQLIELYGASALRGVSSTSPTAAPAAIVKSNSVVGARIIVITGGAANFGPGALSLAVTEIGDDPLLAGVATAASQFFTDLGRRAAARNVVVDTIACGARLLGVPLLQCATMTSGGRTLLHRDVDDQCAANLQCLIAERANCGSSGMFEVACSNRNIVTTRIIGYRLKRAQEVD
jgi:hypothetical protein